jgi:hypothetical protein
MFLSIQSGLSATALLTNIIARAEDASIWATAKNKRELYQLYKDVCKRLAYKNFDKGNFDGERATLQCGTVRCDFVVYDPKNQESVLTDLLFCVEDGVSSMEIDGLKACHVQQAKAA